MVGRVSDPGLLVGVLLLLGQRLPQFPVHDGAAAPVEDAGQVVERAVDVDVRDVDMPVFVGREGLHEAGPFLRGSRPLAVEPTRELQHAVDAGGADGHDVVVEHHEGESPVAFQGMAVVILHDGGLLPVFEPVVAGKLAVVLIHFSVALLPRVELARGQFQPGEKRSGGCFSALGPVADVVHHLVPRVMGNSLVTSAARSATGEST